jgi:lipoyl-dependent peroxiredoxin subunit D
MDAIEAVLQTLPEHSSDLSANILKLFTQSKLTPARLWGTAIASAVATRAPALVAAVEGDAVAAGMSADVIEDARAAASLTSMNNIYYRFRHFMHDEELNKIAPRLPQQRLARPKAEKLDFELYGVAVSSINGCELCVRVRMHADAVVKGGLSKEELAESVRIAAILHAAAIALAPR